MTKTSIAITGFVSASLFTVLAEDYTVHTFKKLQLSDQFWSEGASFGDFNKDGINDIVSGPFWWAGPDFKKQHEYDEAKSRKSSGGAAPFELKLGPMTKVTVPGFHGALGKDNGYSDNFFAFTYDFNRDGWQDILIIGFPGEISAWYENPQGKGGHWTKHIALDVTDNESPTFTDITGDGKPEIVCSSKGSYGYAEPDGNDAAKPWKFHAISPNNNYHKFTHGMGVGDVNGDGRMDLLEKNGWWEQPASLAGDPVWKFHKQTFGTGGAQMYAYDVNADGRNDVITSLAGHGYGLAWYENTDNGQSGIAFKEHIFMNKEPHENKYGVSFSQLHAIDLVDMDGDGLKDLVTGKRFWAHGPKGDAEPGAPAVLYWFKLVRHQDKSVDWIPYQIDNDSGIGTQVVAGDVNGDKLLDIVVGNKKGTFVHLHQVKQVSKEEWEKAQPKPTAAASAALK